MVVKRTRKQPCGGAEPSTAATLRRQRKHAEAQVEAYLHRLGAEHPSQLKEGGTYPLPSNDLNGFVTVDVSEGDVTFTVAAEVLALPSDGELIVPLQRELLELNRDILGPGRLAIVGDAVWAIAHDLAGLMPDADFGRYIEATVVVAEGAVKQLRRKYAKTTRRRKR